MAITFAPMVCNRILSSEIKLDKDGRLLGVLRKVYTRVLKTAFINRVTVIIITIYLFIGVVGVGIKNIGAPGKRDETVFQVVDDIRNQISWFPYVKLIIVPELANGAGSKDINLIMKSDDVVQMTEYTKLIMKK